MKNKSIVILYLFVFCFSILSISSCSKKKLSTLRQKADALFNEGKCQSAIPEYLKVIKEDSLDYLAHFNLAVCYKEIGNFKDAKDEFQKVLSLAPQSDEAKKIQQQFLPDLEKKESSKIEAARIERQALKLKTILGEKEIRGQPLPGELKERKSDAYKFYVLGIQKSKKGKWEIAIALFEKAIELDDTFSPTYTALGIAYAKKGMFDDAITALKKATQLDPDNLVAHYNLGAIYEGKSLWNLASQEYLKVLSADPNNVLVHTRLGIAFAENNQRAAAMDEWNIAVTIDPTFKEARLLLGKMYADFGEAPFIPITYSFTLNTQTNALEWQRNVSSGGGSSVGSSSLAQQGKGSIYLTYFDVAVDQYKQLLHMYPKYAPAYYGLGTAFARAAQKEVRLAYMDYQEHRDPYNGQLKSRMTIQEMLNWAKYYLQKSVALDYSNALYHTNLGVVYGELGLYEQAKKEFKIALKYEPQLVGAQSNLAIVLSYQGAYNWAHNTFAEIEKLNPNKVKSQESLKLLLPSFKETVQAFPFKPVTTPAPANQGQQYPQPPPGYVPPGQSSSGGTTTTQPTTPTKP